MSRPISLHSKFNAAQPELQNYVVALEAENKKLHTQIAHLQVQDLAKQHRIDALEKEMKELAKKTGFSINMVFNGEKDVVAPRKKPVA
jgi:peptidoglycan hydrolase CwlO-like protein